MGKPGMRIEHAQVVKAPREQVFQTWTDYAAWPGFSPLFTQVTVTERSGNTVHLDTEVKLMRRKTRRTEKHVLTPPEQVRVEGETEGATNTTLWKFEPVPEGTVVTAVVQAELKGLTKVLGPLAKHQLQRLLREWMQGFARYAEAK
jgi:ribosome-associated toxin RatA of RatAB toxin-antitoxin module